MDIDDRYTYEIQHDIALLQNRIGKLHYSGPSLIIFEIPDDIEQLHKSWKTDSDKYRIRA